MRWTSCIMQRPTARPPSLRISQHLFGELLADLRPRHRPRRYLPEVSIPESPQEVTGPAGWYPTGEYGPDGRPAERWWDGTQWSATIRPLGSGAIGLGRSSRTRSLIAAGVIVVLAGVGVGTY